MLLFKRVSDLQKYLQSEQKQGKTIGFAPTMGALHRGHVSLIELANQHNDISVCSIFVNPTQFNDPNDLAKYPRTIERDMEILTEVGCNVLFLPTVTEIYPNGMQSDKMNFNFGKLDKVLEGVFRPGHFDGMAQVVHRLLDIVQPNHLYMGQKDFQQYSIVKSMLGQLHSKIDLICCPIIRESDGLAMSSRNVRLTPDNRQNAHHIFQTLNKATEAFELGINAQIIQNSATTELNALPNFRVEYVEIVDGNPLLPIHNPQDSDFIVLLLAVWVGDVRLIDNLILKDIQPEQNILE